MIIIVFHHGGTEITGGGFLMIQSRHRRDWIINPIPSGIESQMLQDALIQGRICASKGHKGFYYEEQ
jgi:hypothetical protein